mmetsp:Transcript_26908/g.86945  ORF Transcript_26908/g.86945 Transcript_26908/m.86945 type:complete len:272 (+) Transcript_26908:209-1024(+)
MSLELMLKVDSPPREAGGVHLFCHGSSKRHGYPLGHGDPQRPPKPHATYHVPQPTYAARCRCTRSWRLPPGPYLPPAQLRNPLPLPLHKLVQTASWSRLRCNVPTQQRVEQVGLQLGHADGLWRVLEERVVVRQRAGRVVRLHARRRRHVRLQLRGEVGGGVQVEKCELDLDPPRYSVKGVGDGRGAERGDERPAGGLCRLVLGKEGGRVVCGGEDLILAVDALLRSRAEIDAKERGEVAHDGVLWLGGHQRRVEGLRRVQGHEDVGDTLL